MKSSKHLKLGHEKGFVCGALLAGSVALGQAAMAADLYVSPNGSDQHAGTSAKKPLASLAAARDAARRFAGKEAVTVHVADGIYYLPQTLVFGPEDSGSAKHPVVYRAENEGGAVLSGGSELKLDWKPYRDGIFQAVTPAGLEIDQVFVDGQAQRMARYPNYDREKKTAAYQGYSADAFSKERAAKWSDPTGGYIHAMHVHRWGGYHYRITGKDAEGKVMYEGGWQNNRQMGMHKKFRMVENIFEELDTPGEWFHRSTGSRQAGVLYYMPAAGVDLASAKVEVVRLRHLVEFLGTKAAPVAFITLQGFTVRHAARTFMDCKEPLLRSDWTIYRGGAFLLTGTEDVTILDCAFDQVGGNAVFVNNYNRRVRVAGCHIHDAGASGICFVGDPKAVRDPLFEYKEINDLSKIDRTPGPKTDNYPADSTVEDCLIHGIGRVERQPAGVQISMAQGITVRDVSIYDCSRSGINVSEGTWGGHLIEGCDVFDTVLETSDHGSFNSWGRDRYWRGDIELTQQAVAKDPTLPFLDAVETTVIRNSRWRCDHGWDIDLDDGSSNYDIYNNLLLAKGLKLREGFRRHVWNNVVVNNGLHPHVWYEGSADQVYGNIFMDQHRTIFFKKTNTDSCRVDHNLFFVTNEAAAKRVSERQGWDKHSLYGDPLFVDPANGDFRVKPGSPALELGFKNFTMNRFGVKKPALRKIARTPLMPVLPSAKPKLKPKVSEAKPAMQSVWLGASLQTLSGEGFSAYGVGKEDGGVVLMHVPKGSEAARRGLKEGDVVQQINGTAVRTSDALLQTCVRAGKKPLSLKVVRQQQAMEILITLHAWIQTETAAVPEAFKLLSARNPILPSTAFIPDGEPRVFELKDKRRVFIYGSRDERIRRFCGYGHDVWSAPVDDMSEWTNHGEVFNVKQVLDIGYGVVEEQHFGAPDCVYNPVTQKYYLYTFLGSPYQLDGKEGPSLNDDGTVPGFETFGPKCVMAQSDSPAGPFLDPVMCDWPPANKYGTFDPGVLVDEQEDGSVRVYAYWGMRKGDRCAEVDPVDMHTIIDPETRKPDRNAWRKTLPEALAARTTVFEANSIRKLADGKYAFIYSPNERWPALSYCYGNTPFGPWLYGGCIIDSARNWLGGNNHGSIVDVDGQWYVVYHRQTSRGINRQAMMEPIEVRFDGDRVVIPEVEMTSQASTTTGLNPFMRYNIDICCYSSFSKNRGGGMIAGAPRQDDGLQPMTGINAGSQLGFKYFNFGDTPLKDGDDIRFKLNIQLLQDASVTIQVVRPDKVSKASNRVDVAKHTLEAEASAGGTYRDLAIPLSALDGNEALQSIGGLKGKMAVFLCFDGAEGELCRIKELEFAKGDTPTPNPLMEIRISEMTENCSVVALPAKARLRESVKLTVQPDAGFEVASICVRDDKGKDVEIERNADVPHGPVSFHFAMPASSVVVETNLKSVE